MGIFTFWLVWRMKANLDDKLEQIRLNQLTPAQRAAEVADEDKEIFARAGLLILMMIVFALAAAHGS